VLIAITLAVAPSVALRPPFKSRTSMPAAKVTLRRRT
jgi:hypothetical protein